MTSFIPKINRFTLAFGVAMALCAANSARADDAEYGVLMKTLANPFWGAMSQGVEAGAKGAGVKIFEQAATVRARLDGFRTAALHLAPDVRIDVVLAETDVEPLRAQLRDYFAKGERPTAVYSLFLKGTLVALSEFRRRGWHCPNDISLDRKSVV